MKLNIQSDFTKFVRAVGVVRMADAGSAVPVDTAALTHEERRLRRRVVELAGGEKVLADLPQLVSLEPGDRLVLEDGRQVGIAAAREDVYAVRGRDGAHLVELAWHLGSRHLALAAGPDHVLVLRDAAVKDLLTGLGATVSEISAPFQPVRGATSDHHHDDHHGHDDHGHGGKDAFGRLPGDPHYGHNHG